MMIKVTLSVLILVYCADLIRGHGFLWDPVNRASRWRVNSSAPANYDDNGLFCGGFFVQFEKNGGKCGLCGDNYADSRPRRHELRGPYGEGVIVKTYKQGSTIDVIGKLTYNHLGGKFFFYICNLDEFGAESEQCFAKYPVSTADGKPYYTVPDYSHRDFPLKLVLPRNLQCNHCVMQWTYTTANNWGICEDGFGRLGCGNQEHFRTCSDIRITRA